jgi:hypothetical protein
MKHIAIAALVAAATLIMAGSAYAQQEYAVQANIPFSFSVNNSQLPPGTYTLWTVPGTSNVIDLASRDKGVHILAVSMSVQNATPKSSVLVFHKYGEQYFLSDIRSAESETDTQFSASKAEKRARAEAEDASLRTKSITIALNAAPQR